MGVKNDNSSNNNNRKPYLYYYCIVLLIVMVLNALVFPSVMERSVEVPFNEFTTQLSSGNVEQVYVNSDYTEILYTLNEDKNKPWSAVTYKTGNMTTADDLVNRLESAGVQNYSREIPTQASPLLNFLTTWVFPILMFVIIGQLMGRMMAKRMGGGSSAMTFGKSNAKIYAEKETGVTFNDVAGEEEAKDALKEIVDFLHNPDKYAQIGASLPKGALLVGPPGTGKTLLAKAPCIVFIDEIDTIGKKRDGGGMGGNDEREQTLNQLLTEMDGFDGKKGVVILAATNRPESLDPALLRPGRFDRRVPVELPDLQGREAILKVHGRKVKMDESVDYNVIARSTAGASGAELANIINEAALRAVRQGRNLVSQEDLQESVETVIAGYQKKNAVIPADERKIVAYHEVGHALVAACQTHSAPVQKITIIPRTSGALGYTMQVDAGEKYLMSKEEALNKIATFTGGRAAEELIFHSITTGASNDIEQATKIARAMVTRYGMTDEFDMVAMETVNNQYLGGDTSLTCSPETARMIDEQVVKIVRTQHEKALNILKENEGKLHEIAKYLLDKETITGEEFMEIYEKNDADVN